MTTITVDANPRLSRFDIMMPSGIVGVVNGLIETALTDPTTGEHVGTSVGPTTNRMIDDVLTDEVDLNGTIITFAQVLEVLELFTTKWYEQDKNPPTATPQDREAENVKRTKTSPVRTKGHSKGS